MPTRLQNATGRCEGEITLAAAKALLAGIHTKTDKRSNRKEAHSLCVHLLTLLPSI